MQTKFNTGDQVLVPAVIRSAREVDGQIVYDVSLTNYGDVPESVIQEDRLASGAQLRAFEEALPRRRRVY